MMFFWLVCVFFVYCNDYFNCLVGNASNFEKPLGNGFGVDFGKLAVLGELVVSLLGNAHCLNSNVDEFLSYGKVVAKIGGEKVAKVNLVLEFFKL